MSRPEFSVLTPVYETPPDVLTATVESVLAQTFPDWELCLVDDHSARPDTVATLAALAARDPRIRLVSRDRRGGTAEATNDALAMAVGEYVALLDHDDALHPEALSDIHHVTYNFDADVVYTDEDKLYPDGTHGSAFRKPAWSPEYLDCAMYIGHLVVYRRSLVEAVGGFRAEYEGSQDWDLALRVTERAARIEHVARVRYHWRVGAGSVASSPIAKPYANEAGRRALADALRRRGIDGWIEDTPNPGHYRPRRRLPDPPRVSVVLPTAGATRANGGAPVELVSRCVDGLINRTDYPNIEIVCLIDEKAPPRLAERLLAIAGERIRFVYPQGPFNYARVIDIGATHARSELLLFLNDDVEPLDPDWLNVMVELAADPAVGAVGAKLLYDDGTVQHAGVIHVDGLPHHRAYAQPDGTGYYSNLVVNLNYLAVTGACQLVRRDLFTRVGGYNPAYPMNFNDIDFCLKIGLCGYRIVQANGARLVHHESATRAAIVTTAEVRRFLDDWHAHTVHDGFSNVCEP
ncbi:MAG TPA: glycosyltransferase [Mycobacteriales bacterium]|nr:glycosyltransferase [Mycobacteriales bacterium]